MGENPKTNVLRALIALTEDAECGNIARYKHAVKNMASAGAMLEFYIKDSFCNSIKQGEIAHDEFLSYKGGTNNPPDFIIRNGDAVEVKQISSDKGKIQFNSSYPGQKLHKANRMITKDCRNCEKGEWEKDLLYVFGVVKKKNTGRKVSLVWFVQGACYAAGSAIYKKERNEIREKLNLKTDETDELGRINELDPLRITDLRIRGIWQIKNPTVVYQNIVKYDATRDFTVIAVMLKEKYDDMPLPDRKNIEALEQKNRLSMYDKEFDSPNEVGKKIQIKLIIYQK